MLIAELQSDGVVAREQAANLEVALRTSRTIGAAIGILMAQHNVSEEDAFAMLRQASMATNRKLRDLAEDVVFTGGLGQRQG